MSVRQSLVYIASLLAVTGRLLTLIRTDSLGGLLIGAPGALVLYTRILGLRGSNV